MGDIYKLSALDIETATRLGQATYEHWKRHRGHYNNTVDSHLRGKVGEIAAANVLDAQGCTCERVYEDLAREGECDIVLGKGVWPRIDVKTWKLQFWEEMGRCVAVSQLPYLRKKADAVVWCVSPRALTEGAEIEVQGWSSIEDIERAPRRLTGPRGGRLVDNYQLEAGTLRPLRVLVG